MKIAETKAQNSYMMGITKRFEGVQETTPSFKCDLGGLDIDEVDDHIALACGEEEIICCQMSFDAVVL